MLRIITRINRERERVQPNVNTKHGLPVYNFESCYVSAVGHAFFTNLIFCYRNRSRGNSAMKLVLQILIAQYVKMLLPIILSAERCNH